MPNKPLRQATTFLLESAIAIAPEESREWGQAMLGELGHVEGAWSELLWVFGCVGVLARRTLLAILFPSRRGQNLVPDGGLFSRKISLTKVALIAGGGCLLGAALFFAAPPFREALQVALSPWKQLVRINPNRGQLRLEALARRAERNHDAEALAFCAARLQNPRKSAHLAEEAVGLNPDLLWIYAVVAVRHPELPEIPAWVPQLDRWDSQNALFPLIVAEYQDVQHIIGNDSATEGQEEDPAWLNAMAAAFASPKFDDYMDRMKELDRRVVPRYHFYEPQEVLLEPAWGIPTYAFKDSQNFAASLIQAGKDLESQGKLKLAMEKYWTVARFGQLIASQDHTLDEQWTSHSLQAMAYKQLREVSQKQGDGNEAELFGYLAAKFDLAKELKTQRQNRVFAQYICHRNATFLQIAGLLSLLFAGLVLAAILILVFRARRLAGLGAQRAKARAAVMGFTGAAGLLLSTATIYLTFRPYWYIFQSAVLSSDRSHIADLQDFLMAARMPPGVTFGGNLSFNLPFYFWTAITLSGVAGLVFIFLRHFGKDTAAKDLPQNPRVS